MQPSWIPLILSLTGVVLLTRWLPYLLAKQLQKAKMIESIGKQLPAYIMMLLVIYEIKLESFLAWPYALPELTALAILTVVHIWRRQVLLSLLIGVVSYLLLR